MGQNGKALGVAFSKPEFETVTADTATITTLTATTETIATQNVTDLNVANDITIAAAGNIIVNATTGTKIGTETTQKLATYGKAPVAQASAIVAITGAVSLTTTMNAMLTVIRNFGLIA